MYVHVCSYQYDAVAKPINVSRSSCDDCALTQIPLEDQRECFEAPSGQCCHVILATNIAESSITLPRVTIIIDWGQRRHMTYDTRRRLRCLRIDWCSKASLAQRRGE